MPVVLNRSRLKPDETGVYIGRPSIFGNPHVMKAEYDRDRVCLSHLLDVVENKTFIEHVREQLRGKNLICFCAPKRCHGDFLLRLANEDTNPYVIAEEILKTYKHYEKHLAIYGRLWRRDGKIAQQE